MFETQKVRRHDKFREEWFQQMQVPNETGPGVRRSKRPLLASRIYIKTSTKIGYAPHVFLEASSGAVNLVLFLYISVIYVTAHRCAGGMKKLNLRSGSQYHTHFVGFFNVPVQAPTRGYPFYTVIPRNRPN